MSITEIKRFKRPNTSIPFYADSGLAPMLAARTQMQSYFDSGAATSVATVSEDGLTQTLTVTYDSMETWSAFETIIGVDLDDSFKQYVTENGFLTEDLTEPKYELHGVDGRFRTVIVYNFPETTEAHALRDQVAITAGDFNARILQDLVVTANSITITLEYNDDADFSENFFPDYPYVTDMHNVGFTRTTTYSLVTTE